MSENMIFCLGEGRLKKEGEGYQKNNKIFNKAVEDFDKWKSLIKELLEDFKLTTFIKEENMTEKEKKENEKHKKIGGYLKVWNYKKAWEIFWRKIDQKTRDRFKEFPNFDSKIFKEITGIDFKEEVTEELDFAGEKVEVTIKGKKYKAVIQ